MADKTSIYVSVATRGWIRHELARSLISLSHDSRYQVDMSDLFLTGRPLSAMRHLAINKFLATDCDSLLIMDSDAVPYCDPLDLVEKDLDIVAMACPVWSPNETPAIKLNAAPVDGREVIDLEDGVLLEVENTSTSALLIARRVLEHKDMKNPFVQRFDEDGLLAMDDDSNFYHLARDTGFKVWVSLDHICGHVKEVDVTGIHNAVKEWRQPDAVDS